MAPHDRDSRFVSHESEKSAMTIRCLFSRVRGIFNRRSSEQELRDELESHIQLDIDRRIRLGTLPEEARRQALIQFGSVDAASEAWRDQRAIPIFEDLFRDFRYACRSLKRSPAFALTVIVTLALAIGANTAIFSVLQGAVLAPLPYGEPDRLVAVWQTNRFPRVGLSYPNFVDWQRGARSFKQMAAFAEQGYDLTSPGPAEHLSGVQISAGFFRTLGVKLGLGREFFPAEDLHGGASVAIISDRLRTERFGGDARVIGRSVIVSGVDYTIVGVLPPEFKAFWADSDIYTP